MKHFPAVGAAVLALLVAGGMSVLLGDDPPERVDARGGDESTATTVDPDGATTRPQPSDPPPTTAPPTTPPATAAPNRRGSGQPVTIAFGGDVHFEGMLEGQLAANPTGMLAPIAPVLAGADLAVVNLETAVTERGTPAPKDYTFRAPATALTALEAAGVDVASLANNHGLDFGAEGLEDTLAADIASPVELVGVGRNAAEAYAPSTATIKGQRIAVVGATQVLDGNLIGAWTATDTQAGLASAKEIARLQQAVREARAGADTVVVFLHWGIEKQTCPSGAQQQLAQQLVDAGADVVVGGHAHRLQGAGRLGAAFVGYGLGNFVFYTASGPGTASGVLLVTVTGRDVDAYDFVPARLRNGVATPLEGAERDAARREWDGLRGCTGLAP